MGGRHASTSAAFRRHARPWQALPEFPDHVDLIETADEEAPLPVATSPARSFLIRPRRNTGVRGPRESGRADDHPMTRCARIVEGPVEIATAWRGGSARSLALAERGGCHRGRHLAEFAHERGGHQRAYRRRCCALMAAQRSTTIASGCEGGLIGGLAWRGSKAMPVRRGADRRPEARSGSGSVTAWMRKHHGALSTPSRDLREMRKHSRRPPRLSWPKLLSDLRFVGLLALGQRDRSSSRHTRRTRSLHADL